MNNNAAAVLLAVQTLAGKGAVAVSRGELVEIGGSFRLPEILALAAARVIEVGTTNRTHRKDYEKAVRDGATAAPQGSYEQLPHRRAIRTRCRCGISPSSGGSGAFPSCTIRGAGFSSRSGREGVEGEECDRGDARERRGYRELQHRQGARRPAGGRARRPRRPHQGDEGESSFPGAAARQADAGGARAGAAAILERPFRGGSRRCG